MSGFRRRLMVTSNKEKSYIKNGLFFHLDGINIGDNEGYWTDLVGGLKFPINTHTVHNGVCFVFDGAGYMNGGQIFPTGRDYRNCTIEACYERTAGGILFHPGRQRGSFYCFNSGLVFGMETGTTELNRLTSFVFAYEDLRTTSINQDAAVLNLTQVINPTYNNNKWTTSNNCVIGNRTSWSQNPSFTGKLYSIRIYSRKLTAAEMLYNQGIDNERFNLGLT